MRNKFFCHMRNGLICKIFFAFGWYHCSPPPQDEQLYLFIIIVGVVVIGSVIHQFTCWENNNLAMVASRLGVRHANAIIGKPRDVGTREWDLFYFFKGNMVNSGRDGSSSLNDKLDATLVFDSGHTNNIPSNLSYRESRGKRMANLSVTDDCEQLRKAFAGLNLVLLIRCHSSDHFQFMRLIVLDQEGSVYERWASIVRNVGFWVFTCLMHGSHV